LDINIISFIINETNDVLTEDDAISIGELTAISNKVLSQLSEEYRQDYQERCVELCKKHVGKNRDEVVYDLLSHCFTWDNYSISIMFINILTTLFPDKANRNTLITLFIEILIKNIDPDPTKRLTIEETRKQFEDIFYLDGDVDSFITTARDLDIVKSTTVTQLIKKEDHLKLPGNK